MGNDWSCSWLPLESYVLVIGLLGLLAGWEEDKAVLPQHSTTIRWDRRVTWLHYCCRLLLPLNPEELPWHSCALSLRGMTPSEEPVGV
jgi:hypothetical protein